MESWLTQENHDKGVTVKMSDGSTEAAFFACEVQDIHALLKAVNGC